MESRFSEQCYTMDQFWLGNWGIWAHLIDPKGRLSNSVTTTQQGFLRKTRPPKHEQLVKVELEGLMKARKLSQAIAFVDFLLWLPKKDGRPQFCKHCQALNQQNRPDTSFPSHNLKKYWMMWLEYNSLPSGIHIWHFVEFICNHGQERTTFTHKYGTFHFVVMAFWKLNALEMFQRKALTCL